MRKKEDKQEICNLLLPVLQATCFGTDIIKLEYDHKEDLVSVWVRGGGIRKINVKGDSGICTIMDIIRQLV